MKIVKMDRLAGLVAALLLLCLSAPLFAADDDWVKIGATSDGVFQLKQSSIEDHGDYVTGWVRQLFSESARSRMRGADYGMTLYGAQKGSRQIRNLHMATYLKNGVLTSSINEKELKQFGLGEWKYCTPGSMVESVWEAIMDAAGVRR